jgi:hypothetical protein
MVREEESRRERINHSVAIPPQFWEECIAGALRLGVGDGCVYGAALRYRQNREIGVDWRAVRRARDSAGVITGSTFKRGHGLARTSGEPQTVKPGGRRLSERWPDWVAELTFHIHENGYPDGSGSQGQQELIDGIADRLAKRGLDAPARATVQTTIQAVLDRHRSASK